MTANTSAQLSLIILLGLVFETKIKIRFGLSSQQKVAWKICWMKY